MASLAAHISLLERDCEAALGELEFVYASQQERCKEHFRLLIADERSRTELSIKGQAEGELFQWGLPAHSRKLSKPASPHPRAVALR